MEHAGKLMIIADMGELKSYRIDYLSETGRYHLELISDIDFIEGRKKSGDTLSDDRGNFDHSSGENHNAEHEVQLRLVRHIAEEISAMLADSVAGSCYLAFPARHHNELLEALSDTARKAIAKNVAADLVKSPVDSLLRHF